MPKRIVDGEGIWTSDKIRCIEPAKYRAEYANLLPLALANGVFECDPHLIWTKVYSYNRPDFSYDDTRTLLGELERVGLLFIWSEQTAKTWAFFVGIDKDGRLPPPTQRERMKQGQVPPARALAEYIRNHQNPRSVLGESYPGLVGFGMVREGKSKSKTDAHNSRVVPPNSNSNGHKTNQNQHLKDNGRAPLLPQQIEYGNVAKLIPEALAIIGRKKAIGASHRSADVREELKTWAARNGIPFSPDAISKALDVAEEKDKHPEAAKHD